MSFEECQEACPATTTRSPDPLRTRWIFFVLFVTCIVTFVLHGSALQFGFGRDDGGLLYNATRLSPFTYFFDPVTSSAVSGNNISPWNLLVYDINVTFFGLNPVWHHLHLLFVVWLTGVATWFFLRLWISEGMALLGVFLFLSGVPTLFVSHEEMAGHYLYGLLFIVLSSYCLIHALRGGRWFFAGFSAFFYLLALACKEVYVPLPFVLLFMPEGRFPLRLKYLSGHLIALGGYFLWRWMAFEGSILGPRGVALDRINALQQIGSIPSLLLGSCGYIVLVAAAILFLYRRPTARHLLFVVLLFVALLAPLLGVISGAGIHSPDRYLYLLWWVLAGLFAWLGAQCSGLWRNVMAILLTGLILWVLVVSMPWRDEIASSKQTWAEWYRFAAGRKEPGHLLLLDDNGYYAQKWNINGFRAAARRLGLPVNEQGHLIADVESFKMTQPLRPDHYLIFDKKIGRLRAAQNHKELEQWVTRLPHKVADHYVYKTFPKLGLSQGGSIEGMVMRGDTLIVTGWMPASTAGQSVITSSAESCRAITLERVELPNVPAAMGGPAQQRVGFQLALQCQQKSGDGPLPAICVVANNSGDLFVLANPANPLCRRLTEL